MFLETHTFKRIARKGTRIFSRCLFLNVLTNTMIIYNIIAETNYGL